eukprot:635938-Pleurochrysis_carterae.AAC.8
MAGLQLVGVAQDAGSLSQALATKHAEPAAKPARACIACSEVRADSGNSCSSVSRRMEPCKWACNSALGSARHSESISRRLRVDFMARAAYVTATAAVAAAAAMMTREATMPLQIDISAAQRGRGTDRLVQSIGLTIPPVLSLNVVDAVGAFYYLYRSLQ